MRNFAFSRIEFYVAIETVAFIYRIYRLIIGEDQLEVNIALRIGARKW